MQTDSSASRTCMASASAVECTATVAMPISLHARLMRRAISPRLAIRTFSIISLFDPHQRLAEFHGLAVADDDLDDAAGDRCRDGIHRLHRLDDAHRAVGHF